MKSYLLLHQMEKAFEGILYGKSITDAAMAAGFDTPSHFLPYYIRSNLAVYASGALIGFIVMCSLEHRNVEQKIFLTVTFYLLRWLAVAMEGCLNGAMCHFTYYMLTGNENWVAWFVHFMIESFAAVILSFAFLFLAVWFIQKAYVYKKERMTRKELLIMIIPSLSGVLGYEVLQGFWVIYEKDTGKSGLDIFGAYHILCFVYYAVSFAAIFVTIVLFQDIKRRQEEEKQNAFLLGQIEDMKNCIGEVERVYRDLRGVRHDLGNHVMTLESLYSKNEHEEALGKGIVI